MISKQGKISEDIYWINNASKAGCLSRSLKLVDLYLGDQRKRVGIQISNIMNERGNITTDSTDTKRTIRE